MHGISLGQHVLTEIVAAACFSFDGQDILRILRKITYMSYIWLFNNWLYIATWNDKYKPIVIVIYLNVGLDVGILTPTMDSPVFEFVRLHLQIIGRVLDCPIINITHCNTQPATLQSALFKSRYTENLNIT